MSCTSDFKEVLCVKIAVFVTYSKKTAAQKKKSEKKWQFFKSAHTLFQNKQVEIKELAWTQKVAISSDFLLCLCFFLEEKIKELFLHFTQVLFEVLGAGHLLLQNVLVNPVNTGRLVTTVQGTSIGLLCTLQLSDFLSFINRVSE